MRTAITVSILLTLFAASPGYCGDAGYGQITSVTTVAQTTGTPSVFMFSTNGTRTSPPSCATLPARWAIDGSTSANQQIIATILSAQAQGKQVFVHGTGACSVWGDTETVQFADVQI